MVEEGLGRVACEHDVNLIVVAVVIHGHGHHLDAELLHEGAGQRQDRAAAFGAVQGHDQGRG